MSYHRACCCDTGSMYAAGLEEDGASVWRFTHLGSILARYLAPINMNWVAVAPDGTVAVGGPRSTLGPGAGGNPYFLWKLDSDLNFQWGFDRGAGSLNVWAIEFDADGSLYVGGFITSGTQGLWRLNSSGAIIWSQPWFTSPLDIDAAHVYASTFITGTGPVYRKHLKSDGTVIWSVGATDNVAATTALRVASDGSVYTGNGSLLEKRSGVDGTLLASYTMHATLAGIIRSIDIDASDNIYVSGLRNDGFDGIDKTIWQFDIDLNLLDSANSGAGRENSIQVDDSDGTLWTGGTEGPEASIRKWSSDLIQTAVFGPGNETLCATYGYRNIPT